MSCSFSFECWPFVFLICLAIEAFFLWYLFSDAARARLVNIKRLNAYGKLDPSKAKKRLCDKPESNQGIGADDNAVLAIKDGLTASGYAALLGTLKKVEQKNTALIAVLVFAFGIFVSLALDDSQYLVYRQLALLVTTLLVLPLIFSIRGVSQNDHRELLHVYNCLDETQLGEKACGKSLKKSSGERSGIQVLLLHTS